MLHDFEKTTPFKLFLAFGATLYPHNSLNPPLSPTDNDKIHISIDKMAMVVMIIVLLRVEYDAVEAVYDMFPLMIGVTLSLVFLLMGGASTPSSPQ